MRTVIIKYNAGNIQSVLFALQRIHAEALVTDDADEISSADKIIFPGVGAAGSAMQYLKDRNLDILIKNLKQPVLGICLGMQLMCDFSEEGNTTCLGIFKEQVNRFPASSTFKIPQVGWNNVSALKSPLFQNIPTESYCYFVHSYYASLGADSIATTDYILPFSAALNRNNFYGVQFHPEKSAGVGEKILQNFLSL